jgi:hypothetical protein
MFLPVKENTIIEQFLEWYYAARHKGNSWYGGIEPGDWYIALN